MVAECLVGFIEAWCARRLETGAVALTDGFDTTEPLRLGRHRIRDYRGHERRLSVPEILVYSSNIGAARIAQAVGPAGMHALLGRLGLLARQGIELSGAAAPQPPPITDTTAAGATLLIERGAIQMPTTQGVGEGARVANGHADGAFTRVGNHRRLACHIGGHHGQSRGPHKSARHQPARLIALLDARARQRDSSAPVGPDTQPSGNQSVKRLRSPGRLSTVTRPPWAWAICRTSASPTPLPRRPWVSLRPTR